MKHLKSCLLLLLVFVLAHKSYCIGADNGSVSATQKVKSHQKAVFVSQFVASETDENWFSDECEDDKFEDETDELSPRTASLAFFLVSKQCFATIDTPPQYTTKLFLLYCSLKLDC